MWFYDTLGYIYVVIPHLRLYSWVSTIYWTIFTWLYHISYDILVGEMKGFFGMRGLEGNVEDISWGSQ